MKLGAFTPAVSGFQPTLGTRKIDGHYLEKTIPKSGRCCLHRYHIAVAGSKVHQHFFSCPQLDQKLFSMPERIRPHELLIRVAWKLQSLLTELVFNVD
jgi:hypothetical protein